jgi:hypothetical protein
MNARLATLALLSAAVLPIAAQAVDKPEIKVTVNAPQREYVTARQLARETGLSERQVRMVIGPRSGYAEYRLNFDRKQKEFREALGDDRYQDLIAGRPIMLYRQGSDATADARSLVADTARKDAISP